MKKLRSVSSHNKNSKRVQLNIKTSENEAARFRKLADAASLSHTAFVSQLIDVWEAQTSLPPKAPTQRPNAREIADRDCTDSRSCSIYFHLPPGVAELLQQYCAKYFLTPTEAISIIFKLAARTQIRP